MPQKIILVRHGETQYNVDRRLQGWTDVPLNKNGKAQARKVANRLASENISAIYTSDHKRAHLTASHIAKEHNLKLHKTWKLREDKMGVFEGWQWEVEVDLSKQKLWEERSVARKTGDIHWKPEGGESLAEHTRRVQKFIDYLDRMHRDDIVVVVSHGGTINRILEILGFKQHTEEYIRFLNTSVTFIVQDNQKYKIEKLNDISHLYD